MDEHGRLAAEQPADEGIVVPPAAGMEQVDRGRVGGAARELCQAGDAAARARSQRDVLGGGAQQRVERRIVAARQAQHPSAGEQDARGGGSAGGDGRACAVVRADHSGVAQARVRARDGAGRAVALLREGADRGQPLAGRPRARGDLVRELGDQIVCAHLHQDRNATDGDGSSLAPCDRPGNT